MIDNCSAEAEEQTPIVDLDGSGNGTITRRFLAIDAVGNVSMTTFEQVITIENCMDGFQAVTGNREERMIPEERAMNEFSLFPNYPNPATTQTVIPFFLPEAGEAILELFDGQGRRVVIVKEAFVKGRNEVVIDCSNLPGGLFFYSIRYNDQQLSDKMMISK